jgi:hypothetical protein
MVLAAAALPAAGQTNGPITTQQLFTDTASLGPQHGNFLEAAAGVVYTDNVTLTQNGTGDEIYMLGLIGNLERQGAPRFDYHLNTDLALVKYGSNVFPTQPFGYLDAFGDFKIIPGSLSWTGRDTFTQALLNPLGPATPDNVASINNASTGPQLRLQPTLRTSVTLDANATWVNSTTNAANYNNISNHRWGGDFNIDRAFSNSLRGYVSGSYMDVKFQDTTVNTDFTQKQVQGGFKLGTSRTFMDASGGYTWLNLDNPQQEKASGFTWQVVLSRLLSPTQRLSAHWLSQFTDAANLFRLNLDLPTPGGGSNQIVTGSPFQHREVGADWRIEESRTTFDIAAIYFTEAYQTTPQFNRDVYTISGLVTRQLSESIYVDVGAYYDHQKYVSGSLTKNLNAEAGARWRLGPRFALRFVYAYSSLTPNGYRENQIGVTVLYAITEGARAPDERVQMRTTAPAYQPRL